MNRVWELVHELAVYEKAPEEVFTTVDTFKEDGFGDHPLFEVLVAEVDGEIQGIALYYFAYSTWKGKILFLDDLVVTQSFRRKGLGDKLFHALVETAQKENTHQMRWQVLDWNTPAIKFYEKWSADLDPEWINGRIQESQYLDLTKQKA